MKTFGNKIKDILRNNGYPYKVRVSVRKENVFSPKKKKYITQEYDKVTIYAGRKIEVNAQKRSRKLVAWKNEKGEWEGDKEVIASQNGTGTHIYLLDYHDKTEPLKKVLFSDLWEEGEKEYGKGSQEKELLKIMENWQFQEIERGKLEIEEQKAISEEAREERIQDKLTQGTL